MPRSRNRSTVPSPDPLSTTSSSTASPWAAIESSRRGRNRADCQVGTMTATIGSGLTSRSLTDESATPAARAYR
jgi:hypothetical protein